MASREVSTHIASLRQAPVLRLHAKVKAGLGWVNSMLPSRIAWFRIVKSVGPGTLQI